MLFHKPLILQIGPIVLSVSCISCGSVEQREKAFAGTIEQRDAPAFKAVETYVRQTRDWPRDDYRIEIRERDAVVLTVWVVHEDDRKKPGLWMGGGGKSFELQLDPESLRVKRELAFQ